MKLYFFLPRVWKVTKLVLVVLKSDQVSPSVSWPLVDLTNWLVDQLEVDTWPINYFFIFYKKIKKKYFFFKKRKKKENLGWPLPPPWAPRGGLATPMEPRGWPKPPPNFFLFFFFWKKYFFNFFWKNKK